MKQFRKTTPDGFRDLVFDETLPLRDAEKKLSELYHSLGFQEVRTSPLEYFDVFSDGASMVPQESMYKLTDTTGRLVVLRPDNTTPMARIASTRLKGQPLPLKLCYNQNAFRISTSFTGRRSEAHQSGVEFIGASCVISDLTCLATAFAVLDTLFGSDIDTVLELGHVGFATSLIDALPLTEEEKTEVRTGIGTQIPSPFTKAAAFDCAAPLLSTLPRLFGGAEVFSEAEKLAAGNSKALSVLSDLRTLYDALALAGYADRICLDLGIRQEIEYYTGLVFRAYAQGAGDAVLSGGRYDTLLDSFGESIPATGFAVELDTVASLLAPKRAYQKTLPEILIHYSPKLLGKALEAANSYQTYELSTFEAEEQSLSYARERGIPKLLLVTPRGIEIREVF